jgi:uncharacterized protein YlzI (FlbEa/FlbD family)
MIVAVEARPDTVITLTTGDKIVVAESPEMVAEKVRDSRIDVLAMAMQRRREARASHPPLAVVEAGATNVTALDSATPREPQPLGHTPAQP